MMHPALNTKCKQSKFDRYFLNINKYPERDFIEKDYR